MIESGAFIHPKAHVEDSTIGHGTKVWQFASVIRGAMVGRWCTIASCTTIDGAHVGDRCIISHNVLIPPGVLLEDDVFVGPSVTFCNDRRPSSSKEGFNIEIFKKDIWTTLVGNGASIGANSVILPGITIGHHAMVAAGAVAKKNIPENHLLNRDGSLSEIDPEWRKRRILIAC